MGKRFSIFGACILGKGCFTSDVDMCKEDVPFGHPNNLVHRTLLTFTTNYLSQARWNFDKKPITIELSGQKIRNSISKTTTK